MIYIASPYTHVDKHIEQSRYEAVCAYAAHLIAQGRMAISPVIVGHNIIGYEKLPGDFAFWRDYSFELLAPCKEVHVLRFPGWKESVGVNSEIVFATNHNIPISYIDVVMNHVMVSYVQE